MSEQDNDTTPKVFSLRGTPEEIRAGLATAKFKTSSPSTPSNRTDTDLNHPTDKKAGILERIKQAAQKSRAGFKEVNPSKFPDSSEK